MKRTTFSSLRVFAAPGDRQRGRLVCGGVTFPCALGRSGTTRCKREGDGATPVGRFRLNCAYYRPDRLARPATLLPLKRIRPDDGWCDDPADRRYNEPVTLPCSAGHERLWRDDRLYDVFIDIDWNRHPRSKGRGSAIFLHQAAPGFPPTAGCVAVSPEAMRRLLRWIGPRTTLTIR